METPRETNGPEPIQTLLARLSTAWGVELPDPEQLAQRNAERQAARLALGPAYADCTCLGAGGTGEELGLILERNADGDPIVALVGDQVVYRWEHICPCPDGEQHRRDIEAKRQLAADQLRAKRVKKLLGTANVPAVCRTYTVESWAEAARQEGAAPGQVDKVLTVLDHWQDDVRDGTARVLLLLAGNWGTGKTGLAAALVLAWTDQLRTALFRNARDIVAELRAAPYRAPDDDDGSARTWDRVLAAYQDADLLVIDDLGGESQAGGQGDTVRDVMFAIIDGRMSAMRATIVTTNRTHEQIVTRYGMRLADRLNSRFAHRATLVEPNMRADHAQT